MQLEALLTQAKALPSIPLVVSEVSAELNKDEPDARRISEAISTDPALTARLRKLANLAFFGLSREILSLQEAVRILGFKSVPGVNLEPFWRYSLNSAKIGRSLARSMRQNEGAAFTAGMAASFPKVVAILLRLAPNTVLDKDPSDWISADELSAFVG